MVFVAYAAWATAKTHLCRGLDGAAVARSRPSGRSRRRRPSRPEAVADHDLPLDRGAPPATPDLASCQRTDLRKVDRMMQVGTSATRWGRKRGLRGESTDDLAQFVRGVGILRCRSG